MKKINKFRLAIFQSFLVFGFMNLFGELNYDVTDYKFYLKLLSCFAFGFGFVYLLVKTPKEFNKK